MRLLKFWGKGRRGEVIFILVVLEGAFARGIVAWGFVRRLIQVDSGLDEFFIIRLRKKHGAGGRKLSTGQIFSRYG